MITKSWTLKTNYIYELQYFSLQSSLSKVLKFDWLNIFPRLMCQKRGINNLHFEHFEHNISHNIEKQFRKHFLEIKINKNFLKRQNIVPY